MVNYDYAYNFTSLVGLGLVDIVGILGVYLGLLAAVGLIGLVGLVGLLGKEVLVDLVLQFTPTFHKVYVNNSGCFKILYVGKYLQIYTANPSL